MHYYTYIADVKRRFDQFGGKAFEGHGSRSWQYWLRQPYNPLAFELVEKSRGNRFDGDAFKFEVTQMLGRFGRLKLWSYDFSWTEQDTLVKAYAQASSLCARAGHVLLTQLHSPDLRRVVVSYFSDEADDGFFSGALANQYTSIMHALNTRYLVLAKGDTVRSGRDALAYVDGREDHQALMASGLQSIFEKRVVIVKINKLDALVPGVYLPAVQADRSLKAGATLLHELSHLCAADATEDHSIRRIGEKQKKQFKVPDGLGECYGRAACRALGATNPFLNKSNADTLAFLAVDLALVLRGKVSADDVLALR